MTSDSIAFAEMISLSSVEQHGYAIIPSVLKAEEIETLLENLTGLDPQRSRAGIRHLFSHPAVAQIATDTRLLGIAQSVLGPDAFPFRATLFDKSYDAIPF